jgi:hypothetical protein
MKDLMWDDNMIYNIDINKNSWKVLYKFCQKIINKNVFRCLNYSMQVHVWFVFIIGVYIVFFLSSQSI